MKKGGKSKIIFFVALLLCTLLIGIKLFIPKTAINIDNLAALRISYKDLNNIYTLSQKYNISFSELLTYYSISNNFFDEKFESVDNIEQNLIMNYDMIKESCDNKTAAQTYKLLNSLIEEIKVFPIAGDALEYSYSDSWGAERTYGGKRTHQGTDLFDRENIRGRLQIVSMTDGVVEKIGWNEKGGYRIGIRSPNGNYYYYAHLDTYQQGLDVNSTVKAGDTLGLMGDSGYGQEGTKGEFPVHLHLGINPDTEITSEEFWINPYPFLRIVEIINGL